MKSGSDFDPYNALGVGATAETGEIKRAYKKRVKETHPDMQGGSAEEFEKVNKAYRLLTDQRLRERYDKTGSTEEQADNVMANAVNKLGTLFVMAAMNEQAATMDIIRTIRNTLDGEVKKMRDSINELKHQIHKIEKVQKRIVKKGGTMHDFVKEAYNDVIRDAKRKIGHAEDEIEILKRAQTMLSDYVCKPPESDLDAAMAGLPTGYLFKPARKNPY